MVTTPRNRKTERGEQENSQAENKSTEKGSKGTEKGKYWKAQYWYGPFNTKIENEVSFKTCMYNSKQD